MFSLPYLWESNLYFVFLTLGFSLPGLSSISTCCPLASLLVLSLLSPFQLSLYPLSRDEGTRVSSLPLSLLSWCDFNNGSASIELLPHQHHQEQQRRESWGESAKKLVKKGLSKWRHERQKTWTYLLTQSMNSLLLPHLSSFSLYRKHNEKNQPDEFLNNKHSFIISALTSFVPPLPVTIYIPYIYISIYQAPTLLHCEQFHMEIMSKYGYASRANRKRGRENRKSCTLTFSLLPGCKWVWLGLF